MWFICVLFVVVNKTFGPNSIFPHIVAIHRQKGNYISDRNISKRENFKSWHLQYVSSKVLQALWRSDVLCDFLSSSDLREQQTLCVPRPPDYTLSADTGYNLLRDNLDACKDFRENS